MKMKSIKKILAAVSVVATILAEQSLVCAAPKKSHLTQNQPNQSSNSDFSDLCQIANSELDGLLKQPVSTAAEKKTFAKAAKNFTKTRLFAQCPKDKLGKLSHILGECCDDLEAQKDVLKALSHLVGAKLLKENSQIEVKEIIDILHNCVPNGDLEDSLRIVCSLIYSSYEIKNVSEVEKIIDILENCSHAKNLKGEVARSVKSLITKKVETQSCDHYIYKISDNYMAKIKNILNCCSTRESAKEDIENAKLELEHIENIKLNK